jgi:chitinase
MHSRQRSAFGVSFSSPVWAVAGLLGLLACGPIGGVGGDGAGTGGEGRWTGASAGAPATGPAVLPPPPAFKVVGYWPSWVGTSVNVQVSKLNYINYAFAKENPDGSISLAPPTKPLADLVKQGHGAGARVLLSIGGWNNGDASAFSTLSSSPTTRATFVAAVVSLIDQFQLDGIDIDWEFPRADVTASFTALMQDLSAALKPAGKLVTIAAAPSAYGSEGITADALQYIDLVNIMAYDGGNGAGHSPFALAQNSLQFWLGKGVPASKAVLGVPFYSQPGHTAYSALVGMNPSAANLDQVNDQFYNGIPTIQAKTSLAMTTGGGIMAWDLSQDSHCPASGCSAEAPDLSLLSAIYAASHQTVAP